MNIRSAIAFAILSITSQGCSGPVPTQLTKSTQNAAQPDGTQMDGTTKNCQRISGRVTLEQAEGKSQPVVNAILYITDLPQTAAPPVQNEVKVTVSNKGVSPAIAYAMVGQPIRFSQSDQLQYNLILLSGEKEYGIAKPERGIPPVQVFEKPCKLQIKCTIHPEVNGWLVVTDTSQVAQTDRDGLYVLPHRLTKGEYKLNLWHPDYGRIVKPITVTGEEQDLTIDMSVKPKEK